MKLNKKIFIVAGESSGDQHAAKYVNAHKQLDPNAEFYGIGQQELRTSGVNIIFDSEDIAVVGIVEVISKYKNIRNALHKSYRFILENKPDLVVLVDYVEFNLKIAKFAKAHNIKVLFYVAPQVWAWREKRIKKIIDAVDHLAVVFQFEETIFKKYTNNVTYIGHPLADNNELIPTNLAYEDRTINLGIFPGSRHSEIKNNLHYMIDSFRQDHSRSLDDQGIRIFYANQSAKNTIESLLPNNWHSLLISGKNIGQIKNCKKVITASGTITLELAMMNICMVIMYRLSPLTYLLMKNLVKIKYIGLVNLIGGDRLGALPIVKEFIQPNYSDIVDTMVELQKIDLDSNYRLSIESGYQKIRDSLEPGASKKLAKLAINLMN